MVNEFNPDCIWLMEPKASSDHILRVPAFLSFRIVFLRAPVNSGGGYVLLLKDGFDVELIEKGDGLLAIEFREVMNYNYPFYLVLYML